MKPFIFFKKIFAFNPKMSFFGHISPTFIYKSNCNLGCLPQSIRAIIKILFYTINSFNQKLVFARKQGQTS